MKAFVSDLTPVQISTPSVHRLGLMLTCCQSPIDFSTLPIHNRRNEEKSQIPVAGVRQLPLRLNYLRLCSRSGVLSSPNICCTEERWGRTTVLPKGVSWRSGMIFDCSRQRGRDSTATTTQLSEINYNSHAICPPDTAAPPLVDVIRGDPLRLTPAR